MNNENQETQMCPQCKQPMAKIQTGARVEDLKTRWECLDCGLGIAPIPEEYKNTAIGFNPDSTVFPAMTSVIEQSARVEFKSAAQGGGLVINDFALSQEEWQALVLIMRNKKRWIQAAIHPEDGIQVEGFDQDDLEATMVVLEVALAACRDSIKTL